MAGARKIAGVLAALVLFTGCSTLKLGRSGAPAAETVRGSGEHVSRHEKPRGGAKAAANPLDEARQRAEEQPGEPWWPYRAAQLEAASGEPAKAESSLRQAVARDSGYAPALTLLSRTLYEQGRHAEALDVLAPVRERRVALKDADRATVLAGAALHAAALGRDVEAREAIESLSRDERARVADVVTYLAVRGASADSAARITQAALHDARESAALHNNRGIALLRTSDADGAEREFERAIELDPGRAAPYYNLAILERWYRQDAAAAAKRFQQYWSRSHADPDSLYAELGPGAAKPVAEEGKSK